MQVAVTLAPVGAGSDIVPTLVEPEFIPVNAACAMPGAKTSTAAAARTAARRPSAGVFATSAVLRLLRKVSGFLSGPVVYPILTAFMR
jgi:hypothetical protein